jgi:hypothetical protein
MIKKFKVLFLIVMLVLISSAVLINYAESRSAAGYLWVGSVCAHFDLSGVPNPDRKPSIAIADLDMQLIECICMNPNNHNVLPGEAGSREVTGTEEVTPDAIVERGQASLDICFDLDFAETPDSCVNPNWTPVENSCLPSLVAATLSWYACTGDTKTDPTPCYDDNNQLLIANNPYWIQNLDCTLDPIERNPDGSVVTGQIYDCVEVVP